MNSILIGIIGVICVAMFIPLLIVTTSILVFFLCWPVLLVWMVVDALKLNTGGKPS